MSPSTRTRRLILFATLAALLVLGARLWTPQTRVSAQTSGVITGNVTPAPDATFKAFRVGLCEVGADDCANGGSEFYNTTKYTLSVPAGEWIVFFEPIHDTDTSFAVEFYPGVPDLYSATPITVRAGELLEGIDAVLDPESVITGFPVGEPGVPFDTYANMRACIRIGNRCSPVGIRAYAYGDGPFYLRGLPAGDFLIRLTNHERYLSEYHGQTDTVENAIVTSVGRGETRSGVTIKMTANVGITGKATDAAGNPVPHVSLMACRIDETRCYGTEHTRQDGVYRFFNMQPGEYYVEFSDTDLDGKDVARHYWPNVPTAEFAKPIPVAHRKPATGIDTVLMPAGSISGKVMRSDGEPAISGPFTFCWWSGVKCSRMFYINRQTESDGAFLITHLHPGPYRLYFSDGPPFVPGPDFFEPQFYSDAVTIESAQSVVVKAGETTTGVNPVLTKAPGSNLLRGVVTDEDGVPLQGIRVCLEVAGCENPLLTDASGAYTMTLNFSGMTLGLHFTDPAGKLADLVYTNTQDMYGIDRLFVHSRRNPSPIDVQMYEPRYLFLPAVIMGEE